MDRISRRRQPHPTPIRATGQATAESIGGRMFRGVIWTMVFPIIVAAFGPAATMTILACMVACACLAVVTFAPVTHGRVAEDLEAAAVASLSGAAAKGWGCGKVGGAANPVRGAP